LPMLSITMDQMETGAPMTSVRPPLTLRDYLVPIRKRWKPIVAMAVLITAAVVVDYARHPVSYMASTKVFVNAGSGQAAAEPLPQAMANQAELLTSTETAAVVAKKINYLRSPAALAGSVAVTVSQTTSFLTITSRQPSSALAAKVVNAFAEEFIAESTTAALTADTAQLRTLRAQLRSPSIRSNAGEVQLIQSQIQQLQLASSNVVGSASQIDVATGGVRSAKSSLKYGALAAIGSLIAGILLAFLFERLDPRFKTIHDAEVTYGYPVLATVAHDSNIEEFVDGRPGLSARSRESFRDLRVALDLTAPRDHPYRTILVTSAVPGEGKSTVSRNLALALAESERRVILLDADLRRPRLHTILGVSSKFGLSDLLAGRRNRHGVTVGIEMAIPGLRGKRVSESDQSQLSPGFRAVPFMSFIPAGPSVPNPPAVIGADTFRDLIKELAEAYDTVVIDSTPIVAVSDAIPIIPQVDAVVLVVRNATDARSAIRASELIERVPGARIAGLVVNDVDQGQVVAYGYGYGYGYRYRSDDPVETEAV
jgi:polysaccharide biosynthesis transport protein